MTENTDYKIALGTALKARADWLEKTELPKLKEALRAFHTGFASLYNVYLKKGLIHEDPYKNETKIGELEVPSSIPFIEADKSDQLSQRLANYDNQLDFLVNFYQFSPEFLTLDRIRRIVGLIKYIDWPRLTPDSQSPVSKAVAEITNQVKIGTDALTMSVITESLSNLNRTFNPIMVHLKTLSDYQREVYKLDLRDILEGISQPDIAQIRKKFSQMKHGTPFYPELAEEVIKEDYSSDGAALREEVLKKLKVAEEKPKTVKQQVSFKSILIDGIQTLGGTAGAFAEILPKIDGNETVLENRKKGFFKMLGKIIQQMFNKEPEPIIYELEYMDPIKGIPVREKVDYYAFRGELERKIRTLTPMAARGPTAGKLETMQEEQLVGFLERNIRDVQAIHKTLSALDDFFKAEVDKEDRDKIRGIKPELATIKNSILRANSKRHEYSARKEEEEQLRRLGVKLESS